MPDLPAQFGRAGDGVRERRGDGFAFTRGEDLVGRWESSSFGHRLFCKACGTPLLMRDNEGATTIDLSLATLDDPDAVPPGFHIFYASRIAWADACDDLPRYPRSRREGLPA